MINIARKARKSLLSQHRLIVASPTYSYLAGIGTAETVITPSIRGRIRLCGSWWSAISINHSIIQPGQKVRVLGRNGIVLIVELTQEA